MPEININYLAVIAGAVSNMVIGFLWYGTLFGKQWMALSGINPQNIDAARYKGMGKNYALAFVGALVMSYALSHVLVFAKSYMNEQGDFKQRLSPGAAFSDGRYPGTLGLINN
ncbi:MAG: hypothetical protein A3C85_00515 [Candidatus Doudnabacteria bacterium RIFCSPHIGHO2_02_FULL_48_21]|uniref:DUF1761 domain-containing protein n=2 Tax=Bacteria candidate phyla TaxID=1783234 RepID=A0A1F8DKZ5_9BACT|nr:MAG: hypothetical protein A3K05_04855 [Candidatus Doudnabacteria bacterium RIFCSPHIGHO2_01_48_18]OGE77129.1 MAG: hypothetical protein A2668_03875 [Candidatus Doudnabacteria bacterium RIFCSPHIGHO2_01_FULL_48_180]OGE93844.1 MAG: hypothetical protein A3C85_00515 [Candidatus Doudnabacteria bacterium RIFCSPHIGHO2_02_FULL_48_21]OGE97636.1 MAG: hypothetical protein A3A83_04460 [Candidatus Doudnabacteria bacterium RIFCSPLOWO2_01_FULL_48_57]OGE98390.1 MAG: hypothetical protein A3J05_02335 [Candidatus